MSQKSQHTHGSNQIMEVADMTKEIIKIYLRKLKNIASLFYQNGMDLLFHIHCLRVANHDKVHLLANITKEAHRIEKGLTHTNFRENFGQDCVFRLLVSLKKFHKLYPKDFGNVRVQWALGCLEAYSQRHEQKNINLTQIKIVRDMFSNLPENNPRAGSACLTRKDLLERTSIDFGELARSRVSIRQFEELSVDTSAVLNCVQIAQKTPSVCNRQGWKTHIIKQTEILKLFKKVHNGFAKGDQYLDCLLAITMDQMFFELPKERHQGYIDGGLYSMSLMYALTAHGFATCPLNANLTMRNLNEMRKSLKLRSTEKFIMFIAVGHYREDNLVAVSKRDIEGAYYIHDFEKVNS